MKTICKLLVLISGLGSSAFLAAQNGTVMLTKHSPTRSGIHAETTPVSGAQIYLFSPSTSGFDTNPTSLLSGTGNTDSNGNQYLISASDGTFTLTGYYDTTCPSVGTNAQVYLLATGGIAGGTTNNPLIAEISALPPQCGDLHTATSVFVSEPTTIAAAFALAPFANVTATPIDGFSTDSNTDSAEVLTAAFQYANNLVSGYDGSIQSGAPTAMINTLADILDSCISMDATSSNCTNLLSYTTANFTPTDTWQAAVSIAVNPTSEIDDLYGLIASTPPYTPILSSAPDTTGGWIVSPSSAPYITSVGAGSGLHVTCVNGGNFSTADPSTDLVAIGNGVGRDYNDFTSQTYDEDGQICWRNFASNAGYVEVYGTTYGSNILQY